MKLQAFVRNHTNNFVLDHIIYIYLQVHYEWRKATLEFMKRMDPSLPFYYHKSHDQFYEDEMPSFNKPSNKPKRDRVPRRELLAGAAFRRASLPVCGSLSIRAQFPVNLPPLPSVNTHERIIAEHSYAS